MHLIHTKTVRHMTHHRHKMLHVCENNWVNGRNSYNSKRLRFRVQGDSCRTQITSWVRWARAQLSSALCSRKYRRCMMAEASTKHNCGQRQRVCGKNCIAHRRRPSSRQQCCRSWTRIWTLKIKHSPRRKQNWSHVTKNYRKLPGDCASSRPPTEMNQLPRCRLSWIRNAHRR